MIEVIAKENTIYDGRFYKTGEKIRMSDRDAAQIEPPGEDDFVTVTEGLPPLEPPVKRGKRNG